MIDLYIVPVSIVGDKMGVVPLKYGDGIYHHTLKSTIDLESYVKYTIKGVHIYKESTIEFHRIYQPNTLNIGNKNLAVVYRVLKTHFYSSEPLMEVEITDNDSTPVKFTAKDKNRMTKGERVIALDVLTHLHNNIKHAVNKVQSNDGFSDMLNMMPDVFDIRELGMSYKAMLGKKAPSTTALSNSLLKNYIQGNKKGTTDPRIVNGRNLISEIEDSPMTQDILDSKDYIFRLNFKELASKGGKKVTKLFKKRGIRLW